MIQYKIIKGFKMENEITLDNWKPKPKEYTLIPSKWRQEQNSNNFNQEVGRDEIKKIQSALRKKYPDHEIMKAFGINAQTLVGIKDGSIKAEEGKTRGHISMSEFNEIEDVLKTIKKIESKFFGINCAFRELAKILYGDKEQQKLFLALLEKKRYKSKKEIVKFDEEE